EKFTAVYDTGRDRVLVFGGAESGHDDCDVDLLSLAGEPSWSSLGRRARGTRPGGANTGFSFQPGRLVVFWGSGPGSDTRRFPTASGLAPRPRETPRRTDIAPPAPTTREGIDCSSWAARVMA